MTKRRTEHGSGLILAPGSSPIGCQNTQVIKVDKIVFYTLAALDGTTSIATWKEDLYATWNSNQVWFQYRSKSWGVCKKVIHLRGGGGQDWHATGHFLNLISTDHICGHCCAYCIPRLPWPCVNPSDNDHHRSDLHVQEQMSPEAKSLLCSLPAFGKRRHQWHLRNLLKRMGRRGGVWGWG